MASQITRWLGYLFNTLFGITKTHQSSSSLTLSERNPPVTGGFPSQKISDAKNVSKPWRHCVMYGNVGIYFYLDLFKCAKYTMMSCGKLSTHMLDWYLKTPVDKYSKLYMYLSIHIYIYIYIYPRQWSEVFPVCRCFQLCYPQFIEQFAKWYAYLCMHY